MLTLAHFLEGILVAALILPENKTPAWCLPSSHFLVQGWPCMDGKSNDEEINHCFPFPFITHRFPTPTNFLRTSFTYFPVLSSGPSRLLISGSSALTTGLRRPGYLESYGKMLQENFFPYFFVQLYSNQNIGCLLGKKYWEKQNMRREGRNTDERHQIALKEKRDPEWNQGSLWLLLNLLLTLSSRNYIPLSLSMSFTDLVFLLGNQQPLWKQKTAAQIQLMVTQSGSLAD